MKLPDIEFLLVKIALIFGYPDRPVVASRREKSEFDFVGRPKIDGKKPFAEKQNRNR
jgi:hypothetical protein